MGKPALQLAMDQGEGDVDNEYEGDLLFDHPETVSDNDDSLEQEDDGYEDGSYDDGEREETESDFEEDDTESAEGQEGEGEGNVSEIAQLRNQVSELLDYIKKQDNPNEGKQTREPLQLLTPEEDPMELLSTPEGVNVFANRLADLIEQRFDESVASKVEEANALYNYSKEFYRLNPELVKHKETVAETSQEILDANPNIDSAKLFEKTATAVRKKLGIKKAPKQETGKRPGFVQSSRNGRGVPAGRKPKGTEQQAINAMIKASLGR